MLHRNLTASDIRKLVSERGGVSTLMDDLADQLMQIGQIVLQTFGRGKRLSASDLRDIFGSADRLMTSGIAPCGSWTASREPTRVHPHGQKMEAAYVFICANDDSKFQLHAVRIEGTSKKVRVEITALPFAFTYHTAERYLEFYGKTDNPLNAIARGLMDYSFYLFFTLPIAQDRNAGHMNIPAPDGSGIFLGVFKDWDCLSFCREYDRHGARTLPVDNVVTRNAIFVAQTFVDRHRLRPEQTAAAQMLADWTSDYRHELDAERDKFLWAHAMLLPEHFSQSDEDRLDTLMTRLIEIMGNTQFQDGIKPHRDFVPTIAEDDFLGRLQTGLFKRED